MEWQERKKVIQTSIKINKCSSGATVAVCVAASFIIRELPDAVVDLPMLGSGVAMLFMAFNYAVQSYIFRSFK